MSTINTCCFDLETSNLSADFGILMCSVIKDQNGNITMYRADQTCKTWKNKRSDDSEIVRKTIKKLREYDILVAHNGARFDIPFLRTRAARWGFDPLEPKKLIDPFQVAKRYLRLASNSMERIGEMVGAPPKTPVAFREWVSAVLDGDKAAMDYIVEHCLRDVDILEAVAKAVKHYVPTINSWGSA